MSIDAFNKGSLIKTISAGIPPFQNHYFSLFSILCINIAFWFYHQFRSPLLIFTDLETAEREISVSAEPP